MTPKMVIKWHENGEFTLQQAILGTWTGPQDYCPPTISTALNQPIEMSEDLYDEVHVLPLPRELQLMVADECLDNRYLAGTFNLDDHVHHLAALAETPRLLKKYLPLLSKNTYLIGYKGDYGQFDQTLQRIPDVIKSQIKTVQVAFLRQMVIETWNNMACSGPVILTPSQN